MSAYLSQLIGAKEPEFSRLILRLESAAAGAGVDVRFAAEIRQEVMRKMKALDLDPKDTTAEELYHALLQKAYQDDQLVRTHFGIKPGSDSVTIIRKIAAHYAKSPQLPEIWSLKRTVLKRLLTDMVPQKTMKTLRYRSAASMLKRESPCAIYGAALLLEGARYKEKFLASIKKLQASDFELSRVEIVSYTPKQWESLQKVLKRRIAPVFSIYEANTIVVMPAQTDHTQGLTLLLSALLLHEARRLKEHASYLKFRSMDTNIHEHVKTLARSGNITMLTIQGQPVYWHHMHRVFARQPELRTYLEPHVNEDDLEWTALEASLTAIDEKLGFWVGTHTLGFVTELHTVSMHIIDVCLNALFKKTMQTAGKRFVSESVWDELFQRYLEVPPFSGLLDRHMYKTTHFLYDEA